MEDIWKALATSLSQTVNGNPLSDKVRMGSLAGQSQREEVRTQIKKTIGVFTIIYGSLDSVSVVDADAETRRIYVAGIIDE